MNSTSTKSARAAALPYFERKGPALVIFGSFLLIGLPLCVLLIVPSYWPYLPHLVLLQAVGLGVTHFFITLGVYLHAGTLDYFGSTRRTKLLYFVLPAVILLVFATLGALELSRSAPALALAVAATVRALDFFHVGRQSFGMMQIWKRPLGAEPPSFLRNAENAFFVGMAVLQWIVFMGGGRFDSHNMLMRAPAFALGALGLAIATAHFGVLRARSVASMAHDSTRFVRLAPLGYFLAQGLSAAAAAWDTRLYVAALTLHYVEYHVIMVPRLFHAKLDAQRPVDQVAGLFRKYRLLFYAALVGLVVLFEGRNHVSGTLDPGRSFIVHIFDGIFVLHYVLEAFLWKLGNPFYREALAPLYFAPAAQAISAAPHARSVARGLGLAAVLGLALFVLSQVGLLDGPASAIEERVIARLDAEQHMRWSQTLIEEGEIDRARAHLEYAADRDPRSSAASKLLERIDRAPGDEREPR